MDKYRGNFNNDATKANEYIYKRAMQDFGKGKPQGEWFEHCLAQLQYMDLMMKNAGKLYRLNTYYEWKH